MSPARGSHTLTGGGRSNTWDGQNRLTQVVYNGTTTTHTYGADGLRRRTVQGANTTDYLLVGQNVVRTKLNGNVDKTYFHGARGPEYERTGSNAPGWYVYDGLGSVLGITDSSGNLTSTRKYDVYGAVRSSTGGSGSKHKFVGNLGHPSEDETGLIYMRARHYDPVTGRFISEDPSRHGENWLIYAACNPVNRVDPDGNKELPLEIMEMLVNLKDLTNDQARDLLKMIFVWAGVNRAVAARTVGALKDIAVHEVLKTIIASGLDGWRRGLAWGAVAMIATTALAIGTILGIMIEREYHILEHLQR